MDAFFNPSGIALVGASAREGRSGYRILRNLVTGFEGAIYPVNPRSSEIGGLRCYPSVTEVPDPVDLAIVLVPAAAVPAVIRDCVKRGIKAAIIESGGFAESGPQGRALQAELVEIHRDSGIRIWGPNCMGLVDARRKHAFSFVMERIWDNGMMDGDVSLVVQSGFLAAGFLVDIMSHGELGIAKACSIGNKVDVDESDLLEYLIGDADTRAIGMYLESIGDGRRFIDLCCASRKPIVVIKGGKSEIGAKAAMSHTASMAGNGALVSDLLAQAGVVEASDFHQMMDMCQALAAVGEYGGSGGVGRRVAILTPSGGAGIVSTDFVDAVGLELAQLSGPCREKLESIYPSWMPVANPVDIWPAVELNGPGAYLSAFRALCEDPGVDAVLFHFLGLGMFGGSIAPLAEIASASGKVVFCWTIGTAEVVARVRKEAREYRIPLFRELSRAAECMAAVLKSAPPVTGSVGAEPAVMTPSEPVELASDLPAMLATGSLVLDEYDSKRVLACYGVPVVEERLVSSPEEAAEAVNELGSPIVLKGLAPGEVHKTERGLLRLDVSDEGQAKQHYVDLTGAMQGGGRVLAQKQLRGSAEFIAGMLRDDQFGAVLMFGLGGLMAELLEDRVFALASIDEEGALRMLARLKTQKLLDGFRGAQGVDRRALARILCGLARLAVENPRVREIDLNPLIICEGRPFAVDATIVIGEDC